MKIRRNTNSNFLRSASMTVLMAAALVLQPFAMLRMPDVAAATPLVIESQDFATYNGEANYDGWTMTSAVESYGGLSTCGDAARCVKFDHGTDASTTYVMTLNNNQTPKTLSFYLKQVAAGDGSDTAVTVSQFGSTPSAPLATTNYATSQSDVPLNPATRQIMFSVYASSTGNNVALDDVVVSGEESTSGGEFTNPAANYRNDAKYKGINVDIRVKDVVGLTALSATVNRANAEQVVKTAKQAMVDYLNSRNGVATSVTLPIIVQPGTETGTDSGAWNIPANNYWDETTVPSDVVLAMTFSDGSTQTVTLPISTTSATYADIAPVAPVTPGPAQQVDVTSNTFDGNKGWLFNRDTSTQTEYEFTRDQASIGEGSLYVEPIDGSINGAKDKFIGEYFTGNMLVSDFIGMSFNYQIAGNGTSADADDFYVNVHANFLGNENQYGNCKFDYVPSIGTVGSFTTYAFQSDTTPHRVRGTDCPATLAQMPAGSTIFFAAINVGQSSDSDTGLGGYLDNVVISSAQSVTTYDYEYVADSNNENHLNIRASKFHNRNADRDRDAGEERLSGWTLRLYKEAENGDWTQINERVTDEDGLVSFARQSEAGTYHVCEVAQLGWTQVRQDWSGTTHHVTTDNESPNASEEGPYCGTINYNDEGDKSAVKNLGNRYNDRNGTNHLNLTGIVFNNRNADRDRDAGEEVLSDWTVRVYKEDSTANWQLVTERDTRASDDKYAVMLRDATAGRYHVCLVNQSGWTQVEQNRSGTPYHIVTENQSSASDEGDYCSTVVFDDSSDRSNAKYFGVEDTGKPQANVVTPADNAVVGPDITVSGTASDSQTAIDRVEYTVTRIDAIGGSYVANVTSGTASGTNSWSFDVNDLTAGYYRLKVQAFDEAGNWKYDFNDVEVDAEAPAQPQVLGVYKGHDSQEDNFVACGGATNTTQIRIDWEDNSESDIDYYWFGTKANAKHKKVTVSEYDANMTPGNNPYYYTVIAVDTAGNESEISERCEVTLDRSSPTADAGPDQSVTGTSATLTGNSDDATASYTWTQVSGPSETVFGEYESATTSATVSAYGTYVYQLTVTDPAGNTSNDTVSVVYEAPTTTPDPEEEGEEPVVLGAGTDNGSSNSENSNSPQPISVQSLLGSTTGNTILNPAVLAIAGDSASTEEEEEEESAKNVAVLGDEDEATPAATDSDEDVDEGCWKIGPLCWYWYVVIILAALVTWYVIRSARRSDDDNM